MTHPSASGRTPQPLEEVPTTDARSHTDAARRGSQSRHRTLFDAMDQGFCIIEPVETAPGRPLDFRYVVVNPAFERHTGLHDAVGRTIRALVPDAEEHIMDRYGEVARTGQPQRFEAYIAALDLWMDADVFPTQVPGQLAVLFSNVSDRKRAELALADELLAMQHLHELTTRLVSASPLLQTLSEILDAAVALHGADFGNVQLYDPATRTLRLVAQRGFTAPFLEHFAEVDIADASACAMALARGERVEIEDVEQEPAYARSLDVAREAGYRAVQSTPLYTRAGEPLGMLSTHFRMPHRLTERERRLTDIYARLAAEAIARSQAEAALQASEARQAFFVKLGDALRPLADPAEAQAVAARILGEHLGASRVAYIEITGDEYVIARDYVSGIPSVAGGRYPVSSFGSGKLAEYRAGKTRVVYDTTADPHNAPSDAAHLAAIGVRAGLGVPLVKGGAFVANLVVHMNEPRHWTAEEVTLVEETAERTWVAVERARTETALRASESRYRTLVENVRDYAIFLLDSGGVITEWTAGAERVKGYTAAEVVGRHLAMFYPPEELAAGQPAEELAEAAATGRAEREGWRVRKGGERFWVNEIATAIHDANGRLAGFTKISRDLTERRRAEEALAASTHALRVALAASEAARADAEAARREAEAANRAKSDFLAVMSHELRTPLNAIAGYAELMEMGIRGPVTPEQRADLARIQKSQRHLLGLINGVLNYAKVDAGAVQYEVTDVPVDEVLAACEALIAPQASAKRIALTFAGCDRAIHARADREKVQQIVLNLLSNAIKFTDAGGRVSLACERRPRAAGDGPWVVVQVADTGRGIAPEHLERVFQPFMQVDVRLTRTEDGTGLGLAISRDLARGMGGELSVASTLGDGSTFTLTLPAA